MRKEIVLILIFMFMAAVASYADMYNDQTTTTNNDEYSAGFFSDNSSSHEEDSGYGLFRSSDPISPGDRPGGGGGIGQENTPLGDGLITLLVCSALLVIVKEVVKKFKR